MKQTIVWVFMFLALMVCIPAVNAELGSLVDTTVISISLANYDPDPAMGGNVVEARIGVENIGSMDINDLMIEVLPEYPFELVSGETAVKSIGIIRGYSEGSNANIKIIKYRMLVNKDTPAGNYELKVKYFQSGSTSSTQKSFFIDVKNRDSAEVIHIDRTALVPGKQSSMNFTINNAGSAPLRDLTFYWENTDNIILPVGSDNTKYIKYIDIGESAEQQYQVIADTNAVPGLYKLNLYLTYKENINGTDKKISSIAGVYVGGGTDFDVAFSDNANGQMSFSVANIGSNPANSVSVVIPEQDGWSVSGPNSVIIGNLNKGDYTVASFKLQSSTNMTQNRVARNNSYSRSMQRSTNSSPDTMLMQIAYTDTMGERTLVEKAIKLGIQNIGSANGTTDYQGRRGAVQQQSIFSDYTYYFIGIAVLAGIVLFNRKYRSCKLIDPDFKFKDLFKIEKK